MSEKRRFERKPRNSVPVNTLSLREKLSALANLPAFLKLVWKTSPWMTLASAVLRLIRSALPLAILYLGKLIIDEVLFLSTNASSGSYGHLWLLVGIEFGLAILADSLSRINVLIDSLLGDKFSNYTSIRILEHAASLDLDQFEDSVFYDKMERARQQTTGRTMLLSQLMSQIQDIITMLFLAAGLVAFNPWLILLLFVAIIPSFLGESYFNDKSYALTRGQTPERRELDYIRYLGASDETAKEVKIFNLSAFISERFRALSDKFYRDNKRLIISRAGWGVLLSILGSAGYYTAYAIIILRTVEGRVSIGELTFLAGSFRQMRSLLEGILTRFTGISQGAIYLTDFFEFFEIRPKILSLPDSLPFPQPIRQGFVFENVSFRYANSELWANRNLNFTLHVGEKLALVGENGAGKSTLVKLLARLYDPTEGRILLDGIDLKKYNLVDLRNNMGVIFQDFIKYQMTFAQNIATGNIMKKDDLPHIKSAAKKSLADLLINRFPGEYNQMLGRRFANGIELSGGEWQKVALARAYMKDTPVLILDEPTSALDARAEYEVFQRFTELTREKSAILISHRFSTVRMADRILVLENGEMVEIGSHEELLANPGRYAELFNLQARGFR